MRPSRIVAAALIAAMAAPSALAAPADDAAKARLKADAIVGVERQAKLVQEMVDSVFSFGELAMQEVETSKYLTAILEKNQAMSA